MRRRDTDWLHVAVHVGALAPLAALGWMAWQGRLGPAPVGAVIRLLGRYALVFLLLSLVPTVVRTVTGFDAVVRVRRTLGLYAFAYAALHFLAFGGLDYGFDVRLLAQVIGESRREIAGLAALVILGLLALTSTRGWMARLGKWWKRLHRLVYAAGALVVVHYAWNYKVLRTWPVAAGVTLGLLVAARLPFVEQLLSRLRRR